MSSKISYLKYACDSLVKRKYESSAAEIRKFMGYQELNSYESDAVLIKLNRFLCSDSGRPSCSVDFIRLQEFEFEPNEINTPVYFNNNSFILKVKSDLPVIKLRGVVTNIPEGQQADNFLYTFEALADHLRGKSTKKLENIWVNPKKKVVTTKNDNGELIKVNCTHGDKFDPYVGAALAYCYRMFGSKRKFRQAVDALLPKEESKKKETKKEEKHEIQ